MKQNIFNIYVMSYKRSDAIVTNNIFEYCTYVVREEEAELYRRSGIEDLLVIPAGAVNSFMTTFYWILENTPEEVVCIADDDIVNMRYVMEKNVGITDPEGNPDKYRTTAEAERIAQLIYDLDIGLAFDNPSPAPYLYRGAFEFKGMPGHVRWVNKKAFKAVLDVSDPACSDIDMAMQELLHNRVVLLPKYFCSYANIGTNDGANADRSSHLALTHAMKQKWGKYYDYNYEKNIAKIRVQR